MLGMRSTDFITLAVEPHLGVLRRYALVLTRGADEAEDLVQEALVRAMAAAHTWRPARDLRQWLLPILHNADVSRCRRRQVEAATARDLVQSVPPSTQPAQLERVQLGQTMTALMTLPEEQREVVVLVALEGLACMDVTKVLGLPLGTAMSRLARGREALRQATGHRRDDQPERPSLRVVR
jgi:RNA polymerase sigma-70 factor (ECF subfamily)